MDDKTYCNLLTGILIVGSLIGFGLWFVAFAIKEAI